MEKEAHSLHNRFLEECISVFAKQSEHLRDLSAKIELAAIDRRYRLNGKPPKVWHRFMFAIQCVLDKRREEIAVRIAPWLDPYSR